MQYRGAIVATSSAIQKANPIISQIPASPHSIKSNKVSSAVEVIGRCSAVELRPELHAESRGSRGIKHQRLVGKVNVKKFRILKGDRL